MSPDPTTQTAPRGVDSESAPGPPTGPEADGSGPTMVRAPELLPLVIGVTGHRDLREEDRQGMEDRVREIFGDLHSRYPATPLAVLSPLAEGADRLVARVALACGARLIVPLPLDRAAYEQDFEGPESLDEFGHLLRRASLSFTLPDSADGPSSTREDSYARVGAYVASHCQILIALWDGSVNGREGGTAQVVGFKLDGVPQRFVPANSPLDIPETGPVYHITTPRLGQAEPPGKRDLIVRYPGDAGRGPASGAVFDRIFGLMDDYNRDILVLYPTLAEERARSRSYILPEAEEAKLDDSLRSDLGRYAVADTLAQHFQRKTFRAFNGLIAVVFVLAALFQAHIHLRQAYKLDGPAVIPWYAATLIVVDRASRVYLTALDVIYLALLGLAIALFRRARGGNYQSKYLDYRAIAEGLRVQFFWRLAGLGDSAADHYLRKQKGDLDWIRNAVRIGSFHASPGPVEPPGPGDGRIALVLDRWVVDQERFFTRRAARAFEQSGWLRRLGNGSFYAGLLFLVIRAFAPPDHPLIIGLVMGLAVALLLNVYAKVTAVSEHAKQYGRMSTLFAHATRRIQALPGADRADEARVLLKDLGKEALAENGDWVLLHRDRPLELPRV